jgi:predicted dehydrogenase
VRAGRFGGLSIANTYVPWWRDDEYYRGSWKGTRQLDGGGAMMNQSIHGVDAIQWLARGGDSTIDHEQNPVTEVFAYTDMLAHDENDVEVEDTAVACLRYRNGTLGQLLGATSMYPGSRRRIEISGRDGTVVVKENELVTWKFRDEQTDDDDIRSRFGPGETSGGAGDPMDMDLSNHRRNIRAFIESRNSNEKFSLDAREAKKSVEIIEAIYESARKGQPIQIG